MMLKRRRMLHVMQCCGDTASFTYFTLNVRRGKQLYSPLNAFSGPLYMAFMSCNPKVY